MRESTNRIRVLHRLLATSTMLALALQPFGCGDDDDGPTSPGDSTRPAMMVVRTEVG